jgi:hypothetical protein
MIGLMFISIVHPPGASFNLEDYTKQMLNRAIGMRIVWLVQHPYSKL